MTYTTTINGKTFTSVYNAATKKITAISSTGRQRIYKQQSADLKPIAYSYDEKGRLTTITQGSRVTNGTDKTWTQTWDYENRLVKLEKIKGTERKTVTFKYDPFGISVWEIQHYCNATSAYLLPIMSHPKDPLRATISKSLLLRGNG